MAAQSVEQRLAALEAEVANLREELRGKNGQAKEPEKPWIEKVYGAFANDPVYDEAMRLGREYRESQGPKPKKKGKAKRKAKRKRTGADS